MLSCKTQYYTFVYENALLLGNDKYQVFKEKSLADVAKLEFHHPDSKEILHSNVLHFAWSFEAYRQCGCSIDR